MKQITVPICKHCGKPIFDEDGFIIHGNVYVVKTDISERAGIIGNNFPENIKSGDDVGMVAFHKSCLKKILGINNDTILTR